MAGTSVASLYPAPLSDSAISQWQSGPFTVADSSGSWARVPPATSLKGQSPTYGQISMTTRYVSNTESFVTPTLGGNYSASPYSTMTTQTPGLSTSLSAPTSISAPTSTSTSTSTSALAPSSAPTPKPVRISKIQKPAIFGGGAGGLVILIFVIGVLWYCRRRKRNPKPILHPFRDETARDSEPLGTGKYLQPVTLTSTHTLSPPNSASIGSNQNLPSATNSNAANLHISREDHDIEEPRPSPLELQLRNELQMIRLEVGELQAMMRTPVPPYSPTHGG